MIVALVYFVAVPCIPVNDALLCLICNEKDVVKESQACRSKQDKSINVSMPDTFLLSIQKSKGHVSKTTQNYCYM